MPASRVCDSWTMVSVAELATDWQADPAALLVIAVAGTAWWLLVRRHPRWPRHRTVLFTAALAVGMVATQSGIATHESGSFTAHVVQHVLLGMAVPMLVASSAPLTLVLQAADPSTRAVVRRCLRHPVAGVLARPMVGFVAFGTSLVAVTFTEVLELSARNDVLHLLLHAHLTLVGALFVWPLVGVDPVPGRPGHGARLLVTLAAVPFHAFVGTALLGADGPVLEVYSSMTDQRVAAGLLWVSGELMTVVVAAVVFRSWYVTEQRAGRRADRRADALASATRTARPSRP